MYSTPRPQTGLTYYIKEPFSGLSHATGAVLSIIGGIVLLANARDDIPVMIGVTIYVIAMVMLFSASGLVHSLHCTQRTEDRLERLDYAAIFFLIAGTYTPICLSSLWGPWGWSILSIEWVCALFGAIMVLTRGVKRAWIILYVPMGWMVIIAAAPLIRSLPGDGIAWLMAGGLIYTFGAVVFISNRPKLWPGRFGSHDLWHVLVLAASACHYVVIWQATT